MPRPISFVIIAIAALYALVAPRLDRMGVRRPVHGYNNEDCFAVPGLEACEDAAWVDQKSGTAYLVCSDRVSRKHWVPATLHLNATELPQKSTDYIAVFDLASRMHHRLTLKGLPEEANGIWVHAIDLWRSPEDPNHLTIFVNSHRPPKDRKLALTQGADSVIEIFETLVGTDEARYVKTISSPHIRTPNNIAATGPRTFYVSNDHRYKTHWTRQFEIIKATPSDIIYCDASGATANCLVAAGNVIYPNGIAKGPGNLIYQASTLAGLVRVWEAQPDHTLKEKDVIKINRHFDNVHVGHDGAMYATALTHILEFKKGGADAGMSGVRPPVEVYRISNNTLAHMSGVQYRSELIFADDGGTVMGSTSAAPYQDKLLLTGLYTEEIVICTIPTLAK
ncbi:hypothetical protein JCM10908_005917 [Rhodotorula pacifica]|uniref:uncharacterized protein n=1 Tax=Rhodotorula pacifica TaxID=1495444 RepID=UPI003172DC04